MSTDNTELPDLDAVQDTIDEAKRAAEKAPTVDAPDSVDRESADRDGDDGDGDDGDSAAQDDD